MQKSLPTFGELVPGEGGRLAGIMRGALVDGVRQPDYALIVADKPVGDLGRMAWGEYGKDVPGASSLTDGRSNTSAMAAAGSKAALAVQDLTIDGHAYWYIPSRAELWAARANVPELFDKEWHWSSTQTSRYYAYVQGFENGYSGWGGKVTEHRVRAFRRIQLHHFNG
jgi:hypothetical protein